MAVTSNPARAADSAAARVETPAITTRRRLTSIAGLKPCATSDHGSSVQSQARPRGTRRNDVQVIERGAERRANSECLDEGSRAAAGKSVRDQCRSLRGLLGHGGKPRQAVDFGA